MEDHLVKQLNNLNAFKRFFVHALVSFGLIAACENSQMMSSRNSSSSQADVTDSESSGDQKFEGKGDATNDEIFNLELHKEKVSETITAYTKRKRPNTVCTAPASPELPVVSPGSPGMTVGQVTTTLLFVCSKTPDELKALWAFVQALTPEQMANLNKFDPIMGAQMLRLQTIVKMVPIDVILGLKVLFCPAQPVSSTPAPTPMPNPPSTGTGSSTSTGTGTSTGTLKLSDKETANIP